MSSADQSPTPEPVQVLTQTAGPRAAARPERGQSDAEQLRAVLEMLRGRAWWLLVARRVGVLAGAVVVALVVGATLDFFLRAPSWLRTLGLVGAIGLLLWGIRAIVMPALRFRPSLSELALRVEKTEKASSAGLRDVLAAGLELSGHSAHAGSAGLSGPLVSEALRKVRSLRAADVLDNRRIAGALSWTGLAMIAVLALFVLSPTLTSIGLSRMLWPWGSAEWPQRTTLANATDLKVHPLGSALALRGVIAQHPGELRSVRVAARYRVVIDGVARDEQRVLLTNQDREIDVISESGSTSVSGTLFERLIETKALFSDPDIARQSSKSKSAVRARETLLRYTLESDDAQTPWKTIRLVEPPAVLGASAKVTFPDYARVHGVSEHTLDLGNGTDERAAPPAILANSVVRLSVTLNKPLPGPSATDLTTSSGAAWVARSLGTDVAKLLARTSGEQASEQPARFSISGSEWTLEWTVKEPIRLSLRPTDEHGITSSDESNFRIEAQLDTPPSAAVLTPAEDRAVLPTAIVEVVGEGRDDVALDWVSLDRQIARKPTGTQGAALEATEPPVSFARVAPPSPSPQARDASAEDAGSSESNHEGIARVLTARATMDLSTLALNPGDEVWITALASDRYEVNAQRHAPVRSAIRRLRILTRDELVGQVWGELGAVRRSALQLDQAQREARGVTDKPGEESAAQGERMQAAISERLARQGEVVRALQERMRENGLVDAGLNQIVSNTKNALETAGNESKDASKQLSDAAKQESQESAQPEAGRPSQPEAGKAQRAQAGKSQENVRRELGQLIEMLDQGEDTSAAKRSLERVLEQQKALRDRTAQAARQTTGKSVQALSPEQREALEQIAQEQQEAATELKDAIKKMLEREQKLQKNDPAAAQAMAQSARKGERDQVAQKMEQAAREAKQNQTGAAQQQQSSAIQSLQQMLQELDQAQNNRDEVLRRALASLIESIEGLIETQKDQLRILNDRAPTKDFAGLDQSMAGLHQNTLGVLDQAAQGPRELAPVAGLLTQAGDAQSESIVALRGAPVREIEARQREQTSLEKLEEAKALAEKADQGADERQSDRKRDELKGKYAELLTRQVSVKDAAEGLVSQEQNRRTRAAARLLSDEQNAIRESLTKIRKDTRELSEAKVFDYAHRRLDDLLGPVVTRLQAGEADARIVRDQTSSARVLKSLVDALDDRKKKDKNFREGESGGGGGGQGGPKPLVPPAAEIALLRALQQEAVELTRETGEARGAAEGGKPSLDAISQAGRLQRELTDQAQELMRRLEQESQGPQTPTIAPKGKKEGSQ